VLQTPDDGGDVVGCSGAVAITVQMASEALLLLARSDVLPSPLMFEELKSSRY
jgi:hypothetical protein